MIEAGSKNSEFVLNIDVAPTLIELAGAEVPAEMQGNSMVPLIKKEAVEWRQSFLYEYFQEDYAPGFVTMTGVRNKRYKYIDYPNEKGDINELYDLEKDPGEMDNLINRPEYQSVKSDMIGELERLKAETGYFDPKVYQD